CARAKYRNIKNAFFPFDHHTQILPGPTCAGDSGQWHALWKNIFRPPVRTHRYDNAIHQMEKRVIRWVHCGGAGGAAAWAERPEYLHLGFPAKHFLLAILRTCRVLGGNRITDSPRQHSVDHSIEHPLVYCAIDRREET